MSRASVLAGLLVLVPGVLLGILRSPFVVPSWDDPPASLQVKCVSSVSHGYNRGNVTEFPGECFFTDTYEDARLQFRDLANRCGAELLSLPVNKSDDLTTDVAIIRRSKEKMVVHISGTHGVEGFAGSAIQAAALHQLSLQPVADRNDESQPTLVFVHVQNPYGMKYNRRVNENNIDVNRNFLSDEQWSVALSRDPNTFGYVDVRHVLSPTFSPFRWPILNDFYYGLQALLVFFQGKRSMMRKAILSGNHHFPEDLGYGGKEKTQTTLNLIGLLKGKELGLYSQGKERSELKKFVLIDVHTGLGPPGVDTLSNSPYSQRYDAAGFDEAFPLEQDQNGDVLGGIKVSSQQGAEVFEGYDHMTGCVSAYCREQILSDLTSRDAHSKVCFTQEFGTYPTSVIAMSFISENHLFHHGTTAQWDGYGRRLKQSFFIRNKKWTRAIVHRGMEIFLQAINFTNN